jgi:hypothetical protein
MREGQSGASGAFRFRDTARSPSRWRRVRRWRAGCEAAEVRIVIAKAVLIGSIDDAREPFAAARLEEPGQDTRRRGGAGADRRPSGLARPRISLEKLVQGFLVLCARVEFNFRFFDDVQKIGLQQHGAIN